MEFLKNHLIQIQAFNPPRSRPRCNQACEIGAALRISQGVKPPIKDEFSRRPISRQEKYQLRMKRDKRCTRCGAPAMADATQCLKHLVEARERTRKRRGFKRRKYNGAEINTTAKRVDSEQWNVRIAATKPLGLGFMELNDIRFRRAGKVLPPGRYHQQIKDHGNCR